MTIEQFRQLHEEWKQSGLSVQQYCESTGITESRFYYWRSKVSIRRTTGFEPFYTPIATVTINLIDAVAIVLLNLYVAVGISFQIL